MEIQTLAVVDLLVISPVIGVQVHAAAAELAYVTAVKKTFVVFLLGIDLNAVILLPAEDTPGELVLLLRDVKHKELVEATTFYSLNLFKTVNTSGDFALALGNMLDAVGLLGFGRHQFYSFKPEMQGNALK